MIIAINLPIQIKTELARLTVGIPHVNWMDQENFHLRLYFLGKIDNTRFLNIQEKLCQIHYHSFLISLEQIRYSRLPHAKGFFWVGVNPTTEILELKKLIQHQLKNFSLPIEENRALPCVILGYCQGVHSSKIVSYLEANHNFSTHSFMIRDFVILSSHCTAKRIIFREEEHYPLEAPDLLE